MKPTLWTDSELNIELQAIVKSSTPNLQDAPCNIIFFPSHLCRKAGVAGKLTARISQPAEPKVLRLPQPIAPAPEELRELLLETHQILARRSGVRAAMTLSRREDCSPFASRPTVLSESLCALKPGNSFAVVGKPSTRNSMSHSIAQSQLEEFFAMKRSEKPPENFMKELLHEFHLRNDAPHAKPRRSGSGKKSRPG